MIFYKRSEREMPKSFINRNRAARSFKLLKKVLICVFFMVFILGLKRINLPVAKKIVEGVNYTLNYSYDFKPIFKKINLAGFLKEKFNINLSDNVEEVFSPNVKISFDLPVNGKITSEFGKRFHPIYKTERQHNGIDIDAIEGSPVKAVLAGKVESKGFDKELGNYVKLNHGNGLKTLYAHCKTVLVETNQDVLEGQYIATVGNTGVSEAPHLHFEVWLNEKPVDPRPFINNQ